MTLLNVLLVGAGGFLGSVARYLTVSSVDRKANALFPFGTMTVNIAGSFILGCVVGLLMKKTGLHSTEWKLFFVTGFCGGFTTFSAFAAENVQLLSEKFAATAMLYISLSVIGALLAVWAGFSVARNFF